MCGELDRSSAGEQRPLVESSDERRFGVEEYCVRFRFRFDCRGLGEHVFASISKLPAAV